MTEPAAATRAPASGTGKPIFEATDVVKHFGGIARGQPAPR